MRELTRLPLLLALAGTAAGCVDASLVDCGNGLTCPSGTVCLTLAESAQHTCVTPAQVTACDGLDDDAPCTTTAVSSGSCQGGACLPIACGNLLVEPGELCDDGNAITGDGTCSADCRSDETCGNGVVDPLRLVAGEAQPNEQCDDGNLLSSDGCSSTCQPETLVWLHLGDTIPPLAAPAMAYDANRQRLVLFGGDNVDAMGAEILSDATYEWDGSAWIRIPTAIAPTARAAHSMAFDPISGRVILFGGRAGDDNAPFGDMWAWDGSTWTRLTPGTLPAPRSSTSMAYDGVNKRIVLFGGFDGQTFRNDTWTWDGSQWTELVVATKPLGRTRHGLGFDPHRGKIILVGGYDDSAPSGMDVRRDTWELTGSTWTQMATPPVQLVTNFGFAYDPVMQRMIAYGGIDDGGTPSNKTFAYDGTQWTDLAQTTPGPRYLMAIATDPVKGTTLMFGGANSTVALDTTWAWNGTAWSQPAAPYAVPNRRFSATGYDPDRALVWLFGGQDNNSANVSTLMSFDGSSWREYPAAGPAPRNYPSAAFDRSREQFVTFGGTLGATLAPPETWVWNRTSWTLATPAMSPAPRVAHAMVYDSRRHVIVVFGGAADPFISTFLDDTWEWDGITWTPITTAVKPPARVVSAATYDEARGVVLMYGGYNGGSINDVWQYDGVAWSELPAPTPPPSRFLSPFAYDHTAREPTLFGGRTFSGSDFSDTWTWDDAWRERSSFVHPKPRSEHEFFPSPTGTGVILFGGGGASSRANDGMWLLHYENEQPREQCSIVVDRDGDGLSGCADPDCWARCTPLCPPGAPCDAAAPHCGDGVCNTALENCRMCAADCTCTPACGDTFCDTGETLASCPGDCTP